MGQIGQPIRRYTIIPLEEPVSPIAEPVMPPPRKPPESLRRVAGRNIVPSAAVIDSQSVKTTESGGPRGFDAAKRVKGRKRHIVTEAWVLIASVRYGRFAARRAGARGQHPRQSWRCAAAEIACITQPVAPILSPGDFSPRHVVAPS